MRPYEWEAKVLLKDYDIAVPEGARANAGTGCRGSGKTFYDRTVSLDEAARVAVEKSRGSNGCLGR